MHMFIFAVQQTEDSSVFMNISKRGNDFLHVHIQPLVIFHVSLLRETELKHIQEKAKFKVTQLNQHAGLRRAVMCQDSGLVSQGLIECSFFFCFYNWVTALLRCLCVFLSSRESLMFSISATFVFCLRDAISFPCMLAQHPLLTTSFTPSLKLTAFVLQSDVYVSESILIDDFTFVISQSLQLFLFL